MTTPNAENDKADYEKAMECLNDIELGTYDFVRTETIRAALTALHAALERKEVERLEVETCYRCNSNNLCQKCEDCGAEYVVNVPTKELKND